MRPIYAPQFYMFRNNARVGLVESRGYDIWIPLEFSIITSGYDLYKFEQSNNPALTLPWVPNNSIRLNIQDKY